MLNKIYPFAISRKKQIYRSAKSICLLGLHGHGVWLQMCTRELVWVNALFSNWTGITIQLYKLAGKQLVCTLSDGWVLGDVNDAPVKWLKDIKRPKCLILKPTLMASQGLGFWRPDSGNAWPSWGPENHWVFLVGISPASISPGRTELGAWGKKMKGKVVWAVMLSMMRS